MEVELSLLISVNLLSGLSLRGFATDTNTSKVKIKNHKLTKDLQKFSHDVIVGGF